MLLETGRNILAVADEAGFDSASSFYSVFREKKGLTSEQYQRKGGVH